jgi:DNA-binding LytR/AlgR family response regulator
MSRAPTTAVIAEDEAPQRRELRGMLAALWPELHIIAECEDGPSALQTCVSEAPDIAFLDIRMPGLSGLDVARGASEDTHVVFITAYDEFAVTAFEAGALDYLLKPLDVERLRTTINRLQGRPPVRRTDLVAAINALAGKLAPRESITWITASIGDKVKMIHIDDVISFRSDEKYTRVDTVSESAYIRTSLKELTRKLDPDAFWRVHRNAIVRVAAIEQVKPDGDGRLLLRIKGQSAPLRVSDTFRHLFRAM